jgi:hypothetical protein
MIKSITQHSWEETQQVDGVDFKTTHQLDGWTQNLHMCVH